LTTTTAVNQRTGVYNLEKTPDDAYYHGKQNTKNDHGGDGKVKANVLFFNTYIARQPAYPVQLIVKKVNHHAYYNNGNANEDNVFTGIGIHKKFILIPALGFYR
jgi:hypothetical protein